MTLRWDRASGRSFLVASSDGALHRFGRDGTRLPLAEPRFAGAAYLAIAAILGSKVVCGRADGSFVVGDKEGGLRVIAADGATTATWQVPRAPQPVVFVGALPDGAAFVTVGGEGEVLRWGQSGLAPTVLHDAGTEITAACGSADNRCIVLGDVHGDVQVLDVVTGTVRATVGFGVQKPIEALALSPNGEALFASAVGQRWGLWHLAPRPWLAVQGRVLHLVRGAAFSPSGREVAFTDMGGKLSVVDLQGRRQFELAAHRDTAFFVQFTGARTLVTGGVDTAVREWRLDVPGLPVLRAHDYPALTVTWLPDGQSVVSSGADALLEHTDCGWIGRRSG